jgi:hypothetical protein
LLLERAVLWKLTALPQKGMYGLHIAGIGEFNRGRGQTANSLVG